MNRQYVVICFFNASSGGHGSAEVALSLFKSLPGSKIFLEFSKSLEVNNFLINNLNKIYFLLISLYNLKKFFKRKNKKIIIIEGASWIGFSFVFLHLIKILNKNIFIIYHAHNVEYEIRAKKNNILISKLSWFFEKNVYEKADIATSVSEQDRSIIKKLYNTESLLFPNGVHSSRLIATKPKKKIPVNYYLYSGTYLYNPNKIAINYLFKFIYPLLNINYPELKLILTGRGLPKKYRTLKNVIYFDYLEKKYLNYIIKNAKFLLLPLQKAPGTKLKIIEALLLNAKIITTKHGMRGIKTLNDKNPLVYNNPKELMRLIKKIMSTVKNSSKNNFSSYGYFKKQYLMDILIKNIIQKI
jgi:hypothetical protein